MSRSPPEWYRGNEIAAETLAPVDPSSIGWNAFGRSRSRAPVGPDGHRVPGLPRVMHRVGVAAVEVRDLQCKLVDVPGAQEPTHGLASGIEICDPLPNHVKCAAGRQRAHCCRP